MSRTSRKKATTSTRRQVNLRIDTALYRTLRAMAQQELRSVPQMARQLVEHGLRQRLHALPDDTPGEQIAALARAGSAFAWLDEEPDLYDDTSGQPV